MCITVSNVKALFELPLFLYYSHIIMFIVIQPFANTAGYTPPLFT